MPDGPCHVAIAGLGLVGASLGLSLTDAGVHVTGHDPLVPRERAIASGACEGFAGSLDELLATQPDVLVLASPVDRIEATLASLAGRDLDPDLIVTDVGSVKARICAAGARVRGAAFVGGHPLAGGERGGLEAARADLFEGVPWVLVPPHPSLGQRSLFALERCRELVRLAGARPVEVEAARHDAVVALTSHLPHLLAVLLAAHLSERSREEPLLRDLVGRGFLDMTRIADGPPAVWLPILESNMTHLRAALGALVAALDGPLPGVLSAAREFRRNLKEKERCS